MEYLRALRLAALEDLIDWFPAGARVLEIGAGAGWQSRALAERGFHVEAVDIAGSEYAAERVFPVAHYDGHRLPFPDGRFGVVFSSNV
jgi:SAM-dependent methyltransferase